MNNYRLKIIFLICSIMLFLPILSNKIEGKDFIVVIDPGHGGNDPGAIGKIGKEKNINLNVALRVGELIRTNSPGTRVIFTRSNDTFIPLDRRAQIANDAKANLFISIHTNAVAKGKSVKGAETYTLGLHRSEENLEVAKRENSVILVENNYKQRYAGFNPNSSESYIMFEFLQDKNMESSVKLAKYIQSSFKNNVGRIDKGVHQAGFLVLRATSMPSVLVELGYISNPEEERYLLSENGVNSLARGIFKAFLNYKRAHDSKSKSVIDDASSDIEANESDETRRDSDSASADTVSESYPYPASTRNKKVVPQAKVADNTKSSSKREDNKKRDNDNNKINNTQDRPVFKIQIAVSDRLLKENNKTFKGYAPIDYYKENGLYKYTYQADENYNKVLKVRREISKTFKGAFIIAFMNGEKIDVNEAIRIFKEKRN